MFTPVDIDSATVSFPSCILRFAYLLFRSNEQGMVVNLLLSEYDREEG
jgi:hypothetical protein